MATDKLPPLPRASVNLDSHTASELAATGRCHEAFVCGYEVDGDLHLFTAEQMRAYGQASRQQALEEAAKLREVLELVRDLSSQEWQQADGKRMAATDNQRRKFWFITEDVMQAVQEAIRGLDGQEQESRHE